MRAAVITSFGPPDVLVERDVPAPVLGADEITIGVETAGVNFAEVLIRQGKMPGLQAPLVVGLEVVGRVTAVAEGVGGFTIGQPVAAFTRSGYAEVATVDARLAVALDRPGAVTSVASAVGVPCAAVSAHIMLAHLARLRHGEDVLVHAAAGGVGSLAVQVARALGARRVIGTVGRPDKAAYAIAAGCDEVVVRTEFPAAVARVTDGRGVDVILESIGGDNLRLGLPALAPGGRLIYFGDPGFTSDVTVPVQDLRFANRGVLGFSLGSLTARDPDMWRRSAEAALDLVAAGQLRTEPTEVHPLAGAAAAHIRLESGRSTGKIALQVA